jgi:hypothetical protein
MNDEIIMVKKSDVENICRMIHYVNVIDVEELIEDNLEIDLALLKDRLETSLLMSRIMSED